MHDRDYAAIACDPAVSRDRPQGFVFGLIISQSM